MDVFSTNSFKAGRSFRQSKRESLFNASDEEKSIIVRVAAAFPSKQMVYDAAHREKIWMKRSPGELIPYSAAEELTEI